MESKQSDNPALISVPVFFLPGYEIRPTDIQRLCRKLVSDPSGCLLWMGACRDGYGRIHVDHRSITTHSLAYWAAHGGFLPSGNQFSQFDISHACGLSICCNPRHLRMATTSFNLTERDTAKQDTHIMQCNTMHNLPSPTWLTIAPPNPDELCPTFPLFLSICQEIKDEVQEIELIGADVAEIPQPVEA